ncbi:TIGR02147 family protein [Bdellovibrionota bacterium FG-1]
MEQISVFDYLDYRQYLVRLIRSRPRKGRGMKSALSAAAGCQMAYLSRILGSQADFSLEQADAVSLYLGHSEQETHFFLLCVQYARAGTERLRGRFRKELEEIRKRRLILKERFQVKTTLSVEDQTTYYSTWLYSAIHMCASVPALQNKEVMAAHLGISVTKVAEILEFLLGTGMVAFENGSYHLGTARLHLGNDSPLISKHHTNWRIQGIRSFDRDDKSQKNEDLHYTSIISLSRADQVKLKNLIVKTIDEFNALVAPSPEEEVHCLALDFFRV